MKNILRLTAAILFFLSLLSMITLEKDFHVEVEQNGKLIEVINGEVTLEKEEFNLVFTLPEPMGLLLNSSFNKKTYKLASAGKPKSELPGFQTTGMAEGLLNEDKEIIISDDSPSYWFYTDEEMNRFNSTEKVNGKLMCKRTIQNLWDVETKETTKISDVKKPLYIVFLSYKMAENKTDEIELKREWIKINWKK